MQISYNLLVYIDELLKQEFRRRQCHTQYTMKIRSRSPRHSVCLKSMQRTRSKQCWTLTAITVAEKFPIGLLGIKPGLLRYKTNALTTGPGWTL